MKTNARRPLRPFALPLVVFILLVACAKQDDNIPPPASPNTGEVSAVEPSALEPSPTPSEEEILYLRASELFDAADFLGAYELYAELGDFEDAEAKMNECAGLLGLQYFIYAAENGEAVITGYEGEGGDVIIPSKLGGAPVTSIGDKAFERCETLTSVIIPDGVWRISSSMFSGCGSLTSIVIPDGVLGIDDGAFSSCSSLTSITIPESVESIGQGAFSSSGLTSIVIPNGVWWIEQSTFSNCSELTSVTIPDGVMNIGISAFERCTALTSINIPNSVTMINAFAFLRCTALTSIVIPDSVVLNWSNVFLNCNPNLRATYKGVTYRAERAGLGGATYNLPPEFYKAVRR